MKKMMVLSMLSSLLLLLSAGAFAQRDTAGYFSSFDNAKIFYQVKGEGSPIVLLHGFTNTGNGWKKKPILDSLVSNGFKVVLIDLRGNGNSDKPANPEGYANDAEAKDVNEGDVMAELPLSVKTGRDLKEIATGAKAKKVAKALS